MKWKGIVGQRFTAGEFDQYVEATELRDWRPEFVVVHNTQIPTLAGWHGRSSVAGLVEFYRDEQQWSGGPHLFIDSDAIWAFTPLWLPGVHSPSWNAVAWGVEIVGDFDRETFGPSQKELVLRALAALHLKAGWLGANIRFHKEDPKTTHTGCPGRNIVKAELEAGIETYLALPR